MPWSIDSEGVISIDGKKLSIPYCQGYYGIGGVYGDPKGKEEYKRITIEFIAQGGNFLDTAPLYGEDLHEEVPGEGTRADGEIILGEVLDELARDEDKPLSREAYILSTKFGFVGPMTISNDVELMKRSCEESLRRLFPNPEQPAEEKYFDMFDFHRFIYIADEAQEVRRERVQGVASAMCDLIDSGKVKNVGLCEVNPQTIIEFDEAMMAEGRKRKPNEESYYSDRFIGVQSEYSMANRHSMELPLLSEEESRRVIAPSVLDTLKERNKLAIGFCALARGQLVEDTSTGKLLPKSIFDRPGDARGNWGGTVLPQISVKENRKANRQKIKELIPIARQYGLTVQGLALVWSEIQRRVYGHIVIPLVSTGNIEHLRHNIQQVMKKFTGVQLSEMDRKVNDWYENGCGFRGLQGSRNGSLVETLAPEVVSPRFKAL